MVTLVFSLVIPFLVVWDWVVLYLQILIPKTMFDIYLPFSYQVLDEMLESHAIVLGVLLDLVKFTQVIFVVPQCFEVRLLIIWVIVKLD